MTLTKNKSITLTGQSKIDGQIVAYYTATLAVGDGNSNVNTNIVNQELYEKNRKEIRKDNSDFRNYVYDEEDKLYAEFDSGDIESEASNTVTTSAKTVVKDNE